jgi:hypothetical protein
MMFLKNNKPVHQAMVEDNIKIDLVAAEELVGE